jgi:hypothetical protein
MSEKPVTILRASHLEKQNPNKEAVRTMDEAEDKILGFLCNAEACLFAPHPLAKRFGLHSERVGSEVGILRRDFLLSDLRRACGLAEKDDDFLLAILDGLAANREIVVTSVGIDWIMDYRDVRFAAEIGVAVFEWAKNCTFPGITKAVFFCKKPLREADIPTAAIARPSERVREIRAARDKKFDEQFGKIDTELESRLHREDIMDEVRLRAAISRIARTMDEKK